ncbi:glycosyltransferase family 4 protein [Nocardioides mesophilus]|uniref:Glycosyltransferase family 4 protein n=1 Tax=Nocardioides mesophilus TaxID=433659 RepID=A0A7G9R998_9ACTN|nr:glycosyltransferase family 4 protein [Nocardioides mesophilus]QNN52173.1 glycosyltransferase family 4 protein [Nocardioides mesophilus]
MRVDHAAGRRRRRVGTGRPIVYQNIGDPLFWAGSPARRLRVRSMLRRMAAVAALTETSRDVLISHFGVPPDRVEVLHNARRSDVFRPPGPEEKVAARRRLGLPERARVLAMVGALSPEKRIDVAITAVSPLPHDVHLVVAGDGPLRGELERRATTLAPGRVTFLGQLPEPLVLLWAADALLLTSTTEGVPGVLIEAGLCGLPVVSTDVGYVGDVVVPGRTGLLVPEGDVAGVGQAVREVLAGAPRLGLQARRHCLERFDMARVSDQWVRLLRALVTVEGEESA